MSEGAVIIAVGNERRRDDGVGLAVARLLATRDLPAGVRVEEAVPEGLDLATALEGAARAVIVAAVKLGAPPGTIHVLSPADAEARADYISSLGTLTLVDALELTAMLGVKPEVVIVGVEPAEIVPGQTLSPLVSDAVRRAADIALELALQGGQSHARRVPKQT